MSVWGKHALSIIQCSSVANIVYVSGPLYMSLDHAVVQEKFLT